MNLMNRFLNTVWLLFLINVCLIISNPLLIISVFLEVSIYQLLILGVGLALVGPSINAAIYIFNNVNTDKYIRKFFKRYKDEFRSSIILGLPNVLLIGILYGDLYVIKKFESMQALSILFLILIVLIVVMYFYQFMYYANFEMTIKVAYKFAVHHLLNRMFVNAMIVLVLIFSMFLLSNYSSYFVLFGFSGTLYMMNLINRNRVRKMKSLVDMSKGGMTFESI